MTRAGGDTLYFTPDHRSLPGKQFRQLAATPCPPPRRLTGGGPCPDERGPASLPSARQDSTLPTLHPPLSPPPPPPPPPPWLVPTPPPRLSPSPPPPPPPSCSVRGRRLYVAGSRLDVPAVRRWICALTGVDEGDKGWELTVDWTVDARNGGSPPRIESMEACAVRDAGGVTGADIVVAIISNGTAAYQGMWTEIGLAIGAGVPVLVLCGREGTPDPTGYYATNVFFHHPWVRHMPLDADPSLVLAEMARMTELGYSWA